MMNDKVSIDRSIIVVIPTLNEERTIECVLRQLTEDIPAEFKVKFIVSDGGSSDRTVEVVKLFSKDRNDIYTIHNLKKIQSSGVNLAVREFGSDADFLIRCDAHAFYHADFLRKLVNAADKFTADSVVVVMDSVGVSGLQNAIALVSDTFLGSGGSAHRGGARSGFVDHGHHALMRIDAFCQAGGYDETFTHNEDAEFDCRLRALGGKIYLDSSIRLAYSPRSKFADLWRQYYAYGCGRSKTVRKHPQSLRIRQLAVTIYLGFIILSLPLALWNPVVLLPGILYVISLAATSARFFLQNRRLSCLLTGPAALVMHTAWASGFVSGFLTVSATRWRSDNVHILVPNKSSYGSRKDI